MGDVLHDTLSLACASALSAKRAMSAMSANSFWQTWTKWMSLATAARTGSAAVFWRTAREFDQVAKERRIHPYSIRLGGHFL